MKARPPSVTIDDTSPAGSWRAHLAAGTSCAVCRQQTCAHSDLEYQGLVPQRGSGREPVR